MRVVHYPHPVLLKPAAPVTGFDAELAERVGKMYDVMDLERGVGLAAPQVAWGVRLCLVSPDGERENTRALVNPEIVEKSGGTEWGEEGCLSFPGIYGEVLRHRKIRLTFQDLDGERHEEEIEDFFARVIQHELDHLDGVLFTTKMRPADKAENKARLEELVARFEARSAQPDPLP